MGGGHPSELQMGLLQKRKPARAGREGGRGSIPHTQACVDAPGKKFLRRHCTERNRDQFLHLYRGLGKMVQRLKTNAQALSHKALQIPLVHSLPPLPPLTSSRGCLHNGLAYENWKDNETEQESWTQGVRAHVSQFESPQFPSSPSREKASPRSPLC